LGGKFYYIGLQPFIYKLITNTLNSAMKRENQFWGESGAYALVGSTFDPNPAANPVSVERKGLYALSDVPFYFQRYCGMSVAFLFYFKSMNMKRRVFDD